MTQQEIDVAKGQAKYKAIEIVQSITPEKKIEALLFLKDVEVVYEWLIADYKQTPQEKISRRWWERLTNLRNLIVENKLPFIQNVFMDQYEYLDFSTFIKHFGSSAISSVKLEGTELGCDRFVYGGIVFNIIPY